MLNNYTDRTRSVLSVIILLIITSSCNVERKLARKYVNEHKPGAVLLIAPDFVYKTSFKIPDIDNFEALTQEEKDSIAYFNSDIIQYCDDSLYLTGFLEGVERGFGYLGIKSYHSPMSSEFLNQKRDSYIFNFAQVQLEEYYDSISDEASYDSTLTNQIPIFITAINLNNWIELTKLNHEKSDPWMLFSSQSITDDFTGNFVYYVATGEFAYRYSIDSLTTDKLYLAARTLGFRHAQWLFDYIMNEYIRENLPAGVYPQNQYTFDREYGLIRKLKWQPFTPVE